MNKEFEALKKIGNLHSITKGCAISYTDEYKVIKQALTELQAIKEADPSRALESLEIFKVHYEEVNNQWYLQIHFNNDELRVIQLPLLPYEANDIDLLLQNKRNTIKQALLKAEKLEKAWEILKKSLGFNFYSKTREVEIYDLTDEEDYCFLTNKDDGSSLLTQEEFELIKEMLE